MRDILLIGAGKIGETIADLLIETGDYAVTIADRAPAQLARIMERPGLAKRVLDAEEADALRDAMAGRFAVVSAAPFHLAEPIATAARAAGAHYLDLTEDVAGAARVRALADGAATAFIPQCGLAPGYIAIVAHDLARRFDTLDSLRMRVGALPKYPSNALKYNLTWSTDGLINEYCNPCQAILDGRPCQVAPLEGMEELSLDGARYEAFNTSGGLGTLAETLAGRVRTLNYKSMRYPGHRDIMKILLQDLRLGERRALLRECLEYALPVTLQDVVLVFVTASGWREGVFMQDTYVGKHYGRVIAGRTRSAIQTTTAAALCAVLDLLRRGAIRTQGFVKQEEIPLALFLANRFGRLYAQGEERKALAEAV